MAYRSTKHYGHEVGLSACFRQWRANSHCALLHGYALAFTFVFEAQELDERNWVIDFGGLDDLRKELRSMFDHKLLVASDDPDIHMLKALGRSGVADVLVIGDVGCEAFARMGHSMAQTIIKKLGQGERVRVVSCEVREHGANSAIYIPGEV